MLRTQEQITIILGLPGSGKTTYGKLLARANNSIFIEEPYEKLKKSLGKFYDRSENAAYAVQMGFLTAWKQIYEEMSPEHKYVIDGGPLLAHAMYVQTLIQLNLLNPQQQAAVDQYYLRDYWDLFNKFKDNCEYIYLNTSVKTTHNRILRRNRSEEKITEDYLESLNHNLLRLLENLSKTEYVLHDVDNERVLVECPPCEGRGFKMAHTYDEHNNKPGPMRVIECANCESLGLVYL
jgi:deoxyadenosine/deoxycytidine kinase